MLDKCLREIVASLRNPDTLRHVLRIIRCWCAEMAKLQAAIRKLKRFPILLVWGDSDRTVSLTSAIQLRRKLRASKLVVVPGYGHAVFEENPEESNRIMVDWLGRDSLPTRCGSRHTLRRALCRHQDQAHCRHASFIAWNMNRVANAL